MNLLQIILYCLLALGAFVGYILKVYKPNYYSHKNHLFRTMPEIEIK